MQWPTWMGKVPRACAPWCDEEDVRLSNEYRNGVPLLQLSHDHGRALGGIKSRLRVIFDDRTLEVIQRERLAERGTYLGKVDLFQLFDAETMSAQEYCARYGLYGGLSPKQKGEVLVEIKSLRQRIDELAAKVQSL